jgi:hypothetical protein
MGSIKTKSFDSYHGDLLQVANSNAGIDGTARLVSDGGGTESALKISTGGVEVEGTFDVDGDVEVAGAAAFIGDTFDVTATVEVTGPVGITGDLEITGEIAAPGIKAYADNAAAFAAIGADQLYYTDTSGEYVLKVSYDPS